MKLTIAFWGILFITSGLAFAAADAKKEDAQAAAEKKAEAEAVPMNEKVHGGGKAARIAVEGTSDKLKAGKTKKTEAKEKEKKDKTAEVKPVKETRPDGLKIEDLKVGTGTEAKLGSKITVHYRGTFKDGKEFDSSYKSGAPAEFPLEEGGLIKGWTEGIPGMKVGGKRKLMVPYAMAYGERGTPNGQIPPKSDLNFEVELIKVEN